MLNRPDYKKLVRQLKTVIEEQKPSGLVAVTKGLFSHTFRGRDFEESWPRALRECGLVDDGTHTDTFTIPDPHYRDRVARYLITRIKGDDRK
jgi:hypothetical protein